MFASVQSKIDSVTPTSVYREQFGWQLVSLLDDWTAEARYFIDSDISSCQSLFVELKQTEAKAQMLRQHSEGSVDSEAQKVEATLSELSFEYKSQRDDLESKINNFVNSRFKALDAVFVRFMELQLSFAAQQSAAAQSFSEAIGNYRKRNPFKENVSNRKTAELDKVANLNSKRIKSSNDPSNVVQSPVRSTVNNNKPPLVSTAPLVSTSSLASPVSSLKSAERSSRRESLNTDSSDFASDSEGSEERFVWQTFADR